jgi:carboxyl-terminal processing protease
MKDDKYYDISLDEINKLQAKISHNKQQDLQLFREEIKQVLANEIVSRYYYQKGRILYNMKYDKDVKKAVEILIDQQEYKRILSGE